VALSRPAGVEATGRVRNPVFERMFER
ncbi:MAG: hypothetical protein QOJ29_3871, partial [Thermoleophilaceae bacterium]|nr:hypothetical protein [Thermoleophilaceae bacterium]